MSREIFLTITSDNRIEFMNAKEVEAMGIIQFAHSYCSWERESNKSNNRLIRRFLKKKRKGKNFEEIYEKLFRKEQSKKIF